MMYLYVGSGFRDCNYLHNYHHFYVVFGLVLCFHFFFMRFGFFFPPLFVSFSFPFSFLEFIMWVEMDVLLGGCSVLCRMYDRGKEVVRE